MGRGIFSVPHDLVLFASNSGSSPSLLQPAPRWLRRVTGASPLIAQFAEGLVRSSSPRVGEPSSPPVELARSTTATLKPASPRGPRIGEDATGKVNCGHLRFLSPKTWCLSQTTWLLSQVDRSFGSWAKQVWFPDVYLFFSILAAVVAPLRKILFLARLSVRC